MKAILTAVATLALSSHALAYSTHWNCVEVRTGKAYQVTHDNHTREALIVDKFSGAVIVAATDSYLTNSGRPRLYTTERSEAEGKELFIAACGLDPRPRRGTMNAVVWSGKFKGFTPFADLCLTCE